MSLIVAFCCASPWPCFSKVGAIDLPSAAVRRIACASDIAIGAVKRTYALSTGEQPACALVRVHSQRAEKGLRTV